MTKHSVLILILFLIIHLGCTSESNPASDSELPLTIKIPRINANMLLLYSDIFESVKLISLESGENCLIGNIRDIKCSDNRFFIKEYDDSKVILEFDNEGKFVTQIGGIGQGPGEYVSVSDIALDPWQNQIIISNPSRKNLQYYDFNGNYIKDVKVDLYFRSFTLCDKDNYFINVDDRGNSRLDVHAGKLLLINNMGEVLFSAFSERLEYTYSHLSSLNVSTKKVLYHPAYSTSIYEIEDQTVTEKYSFDFGQHAIPDAYLSSMPEQELDRALRKTEYARISSMLETKSHLLFMLIFKGMVYQCYYSKKSQKVMMGNVLINDLYGLAGGMFPLSTQGNKLITSLSPAQMLFYSENLGNSRPSSSAIQEIYNDMFKKNPRLSAKDLSKYIAEIKRGKFNMTNEEFSFIQSIDENDNPIIMELTLKDF